MKEKKSKKKKKKLEAPVVVHRRFGAVTKAVCKACVEVPRSNKQHAHKADDTKERGEQSQVITAGSCKLSKRMQASNQA